MSVERLTVANSLQVGQIEAKHVKIYDSKITQRQEEKGEKLEENKNRTGVPDKFGSLSCHMEKLHTHVPV